MATAARRTACLHVSRAMQAARRPSGFDFPSRLGRRAEAGPRRVLPRVGPPLAYLLAVVIGLMNFGSILSSSRYSMNSSLALPPSLLLA